MPSARVLFIDNYDSFTYNVVHLLASQGGACDVIMNDDERLTPQLVSQYRLLVVGPGPGNPSQQPRMMAALRSAIEAKMPVFGVCLGLQAIGEAFGARVTHAPSQMHGKTSEIENDGSGIFGGLPSRFTATRYHSLCLDPASIPEELVVTARSGDGVVQGLAHRTLPIHAVQFHPESVLSQHGAAIARNMLVLADVDTSAPA
ncbi:MAG TPA: aminodeoxychorismate/anthranilate synthase component II [Candidatus Baltobacteraceae bacterium]|jgi:anthranilate synthase/aminodeoxychorismate synthase-like glutamine amidotransferase|nr:aminodeoxychorismate/anthranilate synthase component II [Candidatus Baltobacteraceae bacterium]